MSRLSEIVRQWRHEAGFSQPELARQLGISQQALQQLEAGATRNPRYLITLARLMGADPAALAEGEFLPAPAGTRPIAAAKATPQPNAGGLRPATLGPRDLPVFVSAQAGPDGMMVSYEPIEWIERPGPLAGVPDAFAMYVVNDSMEPRYRQGDLLLVHPQRPVRRGKDVLLVKAGEGAEHEAFVKELVSLDAQRVVLRQLNPEASFEVPRSEIAGLHLVVGVWYGG